MQQLALRILVVLFGDIKNNLQNDGPPELLAHARRGPRATPTEDEMCEYLLTRRAPGERRAKIQEDAAAATLSFQRRTHALKAHFLVRHKRAPLGTPVATWDQAEAQSREALHSHILKWDKRWRITKEGYTPRPQCQPKVGIPTQRV